MNICGVNNFHKDSPTPFYHFFKLFKTKIKTIVLFDKINIQTNQKVFLKGVMFD